MTYTSHSRNFGTVIDYDTLNTHIRIGMTMYTDYCVQTLIALFRLYCEHTVRVENKQ